ncbi:hypothetical protein [Streptomyces sp. 351MFTsu5.1]|uniref:hypothetical protein n=1 Tax=Streptomyces sp. 351MFTsu5.1 TaxID=1172180 RepID=UPI00035C8E03|nr:hypothetical protein [Streptomyces sp. 351MFTsu5.1]
MNTTTELIAKAEVGRRVTYAYYNARPAEHPGVITGTKIAPSGTLVALVRLDGTRSSIHIPADHEGLHYLDEVGPVPELPMGRFQPGLQHPAMDYAYDGVLVLEFDEGDMAAITGDRDKAEAAVATYLREQAGVEDEADIRDELAELKSQWVVFEWEPEGAECAWLMNHAAEGDDQALQVHYLPAP